MDFIETIRPTIPLAMRDILTGEVDYIMMGLLAETFWGGLEGNAEFVAYLREVMRPDMDLTTGANAVQAALSKFEVKNISVVSPYQPIDNEQVLRFFEESRFNVISNIDLRCDTAISISHTPQKDIIQFVLNDLDDDNVEATAEAVYANRRRNDLAFFPRPRHQR
tara:strand:+ start:195 stop:689 length:495 start_codon:yes stop_codon:yes gene_type:complete